MFAYIERGNLESEPPKSKQKKEKKTKKAGESLQGDLMARSTNESS